MTDTTTSLPIIDGNSAVRQLKTEADNTGVLTPHSVPEIGGNVVGPNNPLPSTVVNTQFVPSLPEGVPTTIGAGLTYNSGPALSQGCKSIAVGVTLSQVGSLNIQRYIDTAGEVAVGGLVTQALTASTPGWIVVADGIPWASMILTITNSSGVTANVTNYAALLSAN